MLKSNKVSSRANMFRVEFLFVCFFVFGFATSADPCLKNDCSLRQFVGLLETVSQCGRNVMKNGLPLLNIPVLDPFHLELKSVDVSTVYITCDFLLTDVLIKDLSNFRFGSDGDGLHEAFIDIHVGGEMSLKYDGKGKIMGIVDVFGNGNIDVKLELDGRLYFLEDEREDFFQLQKMEAKELTVKPNIKITGINDDESVSLAASRYLEELVISGVKHIKEKLFSNYIDELNVLFKATRSSHAVLILIVEPYLSQLCAAEAPTSE